MTDGPRRTDAGDLGEPQLVDGGFNGWRIPPSDGPTEVRLHWSAQTPLTIALLITLLAVIGCIVLAVLDRKRVPIPIPPAARFEFPGRREPRRVMVVAGVIWIVAAIVLIGPQWGLLAAAGALVLVVLPRPRLAGVVAAVILGTIGAVIVVVVLDERPFPNAGWPARFEWLHPWGLFAAVSLAVTAAAGISAPSRNDHRDSA